MIIRISNIQPGKWKQAAKIEDVSPADEDKIKKAGIGFDKYKWTYISYQRSTSKIISFQKYMYAFSYLSQVT